MPWYQPFSSDVTYIPSSVVHSTKKACTEFHSSYLNMLVMFYISFDE